MDEYLQNNRDLWNEITPIHVASEFYDVEGFKNGRNRLFYPVEFEEVGDVTGKSLSHLQCHFGMDTLTWARRGAKVTGVDFSDEAIKKARSLSAELGIPADFICSDIYELPQKLDKKFDIVYTSGGVLTWLPDLGKWASVIAHFLKYAGFSISWKATRSSVFSMILRMPWNRKSGTHITSAMNRNTSSRKEIMPTLMPRSPMAHMSGIMALAK